MKKIFITGIFMISFASLASANPDSLLSHKSEKQPFKLSLYQKKLEEKKDLTLPLKEEKELLKQLAEFELGRFLLANKGLNGYWTAYIILNGPQKDNLTELESWMLNKAPVCRATRERFQIFKECLQKYVKNDVAMASIPCGLMDDLLRLDYKGVQDVRLVGIDLDEESLSLAALNSKQYSIPKAEFLEKDAWNLGISQEYDVITSNGLSIYQPDDEKVVMLYKEFYKSLKTNGVLITSFLTPPPALSPESTWRNYNTADILKQKAVFADIIQAKWQVFRTEKQTRSLLAKAGFQVVETLYDSQGIFPTIVAKKMT